MKEGIQYISHCPLTFYHENDNYKTHLTLATYDGLMQEEYLQLLSEEEKKRYNDYKYPARKKSFLLGRSTAKLAIKELCNVEPGSYSVVSGIFSQPVIEGLPEKIQVSISHTNDVCASIAHYEHFPVGIDIEKIHAPNIDVIMKVLTSDEKKLVESDELNAFLLWTAKESLGKAMRTGITIPLKLMEINSIEKSGEIYQLAFSNFGQYKSLSFQYRSNIVSISYPYNSDADNTDLENIKRLAKDSYS